MLVERFALGAHRFVSIVFLSTQFLDVFRDHLWRAVIWVLSSRICAISLVICLWTGIPSNVPDHLHIKIDIHSLQVLLDLDVV